MKIGPLVNDIRIILVLRGSSFFILSICLSVCVNKICHVFTTREDGGVLHFAALILGLPNNKLILVYEKKVKI